MAMVCGNTFAQTVFNFSELYGEKTISNIGELPQTLNGITISFAKGNSSTNPAYNKDGSVRLYGGSSTVLDGCTMTFISSSKNITTIILEHGEIEKWGVLSANVGNLVEDDNKNVTWTGNASEVIFTASRNADNATQATQNRYIKATVVLEGETIEIYKYTKATSIESGKQYLMVVDVEGALKIAQPVPSNENYDYLDVVDATVNNDAIEITELSNEPMTITATNGGYTIMQSDGRYLYQQSGTYTNFNASTNPTSGNIWTIKGESDGTFTITNVDTKKYVQFDSNYKSFGCYDEEKGILPYLYVKDETATGITDVTVEKEFDENAPIYNLSGQRVDKNAKGILIQNGKKFIRR